MFIVVIIYIWTVRKYITFRKHFTSVTLCQETHIQCHMGLQVILGSVWLGLCAWPVRTGQISTSQKSLKLSTECIATGKFHRPRERPKSLLTNTGCPLAQDILVIMIVTYQLLPDFTDPYPTHTDKRTRNSPSRHEQALGLWDWRGRGGRAVPANQKPR